MEKVNLLRMAQVFTRDKMPIDKSKWPFSIKIEIPVIIDWDFWEINAFSAVIKVNKYLIIIIWY